MQATTPADFTRSPKIVYATVSAFGVRRLATAPSGRRLPGYDSLIQALSGMISITGHPDGPLTRVAPRPSTSRPDCGW